MRRLALLVVVVAILAGGGALTAQLASTSVEETLPILQQTDDPEASVFEAVPWQAQQFFLVIGFIIFNMVGIGVTIALIMWFLSREVTIAKATPTETESEEKAITQS